MGQAWCREKSSKAQDSKSPLDRVFVRCAHTIYPGLKEEGSVLSGATQRVTSSEIGYAGSPPRAALLRGQSIDSVDRPFHPSEWVDVNLEVPCEPRASVILAGARQQRAVQPGVHSNGSRIPHDLTATIGGTPVPPPRRRRRRERRPLPPKPGNDDEYEPDPLYSKLTSARPAAGAPDVGRSTDSVDEVDGPVDSDDEFVAIERSLQKQLEEVSTAGAQKPARPKTRSTSSLPDVAELLGGPSTPAERPPRHVKTASLPRDASLQAPQTPERIFFPRRIEEDSAAKDSTGDNSIFKGAVGSPDSSLILDADAKTSTPVKAAEAGGHERDTSSPRGTASFHDGFESFEDESTPSGNDTSSRLTLPDEPVLIGINEVERPGSAERGDSPLRRNEDAGYGSKNSSNLFSQSGGSNQPANQDIQELSSGILRDASVDSGDSGRLENAANAGHAMLQRTISEESLPREMLVDELDDDEEEDEVVEGVVEEPSDVEGDAQQQQQQQPEAEKSAKEASNQLTRQISANESDALKTPPPTPEIRNQPTFPNGVNKSSENKPEAAEDEMHLHSATPSLTEFENALHILERQHDSRLRQAEKDASPEPQIVPVQQPSSPLPRIKKQPAGERLVDFPRPASTNPFDDFKNDDDTNASGDESPAKSSSQQVSSAADDSSVVEPVIVPTPPRRRHRSRSNLNSSAEQQPPPEDRLI